MGDREQHIVTEANVLQHVAVLITRVEVNEREADEQKRISDLRHKENRESLHAIRNKLQETADDQHTSEQAMIDLIHKNQMEMLRCLSEVSEKFGNIDGRLKQYAAYVAGGMVVGGFLFQVLKFWLEHK